VAASQRLEPPARQQGPQAGGQALGRLRSGRARAEAVDLLDQQAPRALLVEAVRPGRLGGRGGGRPVAVVVAVEVEVAAGGVDERRADEDLDRERDEEDAGGPVSRRRSPPRAAGSVEMSHPG
jgi:hypothetical protein